MPLGLAAGINTNRIDVVSLPHEELVCADEAIGERSCMEGRLVLRDTARSR